MKQGTVADKKDHRLFEKANIRFKDKEKYFAGEYAVTKQRRLKLYPAEGQNPGKPEHLN